MRAALGASRARIAQQLVAESLTLALWAAAPDCCSRAWASAHCTPWRPTFRDSRRSPCACRSSSSPSASHCSRVRCPARRPSCMCCARPGELAARPRRRRRQARGETDAQRAGRGRAGALLVLLVGAGLLIRSLVRLIATGVGFDTERLLTATVELPAARYPEEVQRAAFYNGLVERVETLPGVEAASAITFAPLSGFGSATYFWANDRPVPQPGEQPTAEIRWDFVLARRVRERVITDVRAALEGTEGRRTAVLAAAPRSSKRSWEPVTATWPSRSGPSPWPRRRDPGCPGP